MQVVLLQIYIFTECSEYNITSKGKNIFLQVHPDVNSGHPGSITCLHANSASLALEQLVLFLKESHSGSSLSRQDIKQLLLLCIDIIVQINQVKGCRCITEIYYDPELQRQQRA